MSRAMKAKQKVKKKIVKDKVFGCDLVEHLQLSGQEVPQVLKSCTEFVEEHGIVDGIYRLCGISSNVQKLRQEFDLERPPDLNKSPYLQDVHCVSSLCKAYFRELPNPLLTYQLYDKFADAVAIQMEEPRLIKIRDVLKELPLPHYRTLEYLMKHLIHVASFSTQTNMHTRNLAIVWAPNLLRSKDIESSGFNGTAAFMEVRVQSIVVEFILTHVEQLFGIGSADGNLSSPPSMMNWSTCVPEDYYRSLSYNLPNMLNHGDGPPQIRPYHTIIEFSDHKRKGSLKAKKWKSIFNLGRSNNDSKRKSTKQDEKDEKLDKMNLRPAKSMDSLSSVPYTADANDLEQRGLTRRLSKHQVPLRRESLGAKSKKDEAGYEFSDAGEQAQPGEANEGDYEEEGQAKSEPTTPKPGRASMVTTPQGRSPKTNRNRAEKCVGVHISGPFSVTLPFHITSNLSRLTRGMECPSLSYSSLHRSSERLFSAEGNLFMGSNDTDRVRLTMMSHIDRENNEPKESTIKEESEQKTETHRISLEVQDTFSFLDSQDTNPDETTSVCKAAEENPTEKTAEYSAEENPTERIVEYSAEENPTERIVEYYAEENPTEGIVEYSADSEMLQFDLQHNIQMEEFSVEPPQDDPCTEDEADQMYFTPAGCLDREDPLRIWHDSLEDVYLSAYDDLSPSSEKSKGGYELEEGNTEHGEDEQTKGPKDKERMEEKASDGPPDTTTHGHQEALCDLQKPMSQPDVTDGSNNPQRDKENQCHLWGGATSEVIGSIEESGCCIERGDLTPRVHEDNPTKETMGSSRSANVTPGTNLEHKGNVEGISILLSLQDGAMDRKDDMRELEAMLLDLCSPDLPIPEYNGKDIPPMGDFNNKDLDCPEQQEPGQCSQEVLLINQPTVMNLNLADVRGPQYHDGDLPLLQDPQYHDGDLPLLQDPQYHDGDLPLVQDPQYHDGDHPLLQDPQYHDGDLPLVQNPQYHDVDVPLLQDPQYHDGDVPLVQDPQYHDGDVPLVQDPQYHDGDVPLLQDAQYHDGDVPLVQDPQYHNGDVPLVNALKNLDSPKHLDKDDILQEENTEPHLETVQLGSECAEDLNIVEDNMTPKTTENKEEPPCCLSDIQVDDNPQPRADNPINMAENIRLPGILSPETAEDQHQENKASPREEGRSTIGNHRQASESSQCDLGFLHEMKDVTPQLDNRGSSTPPHRSQLLDSQISSSKEPQLSNPSKFPAGASSMNPDGSATMKLAFTSNNVQHIKSVPVVPPKPQFAKLPPALKSKLHCSSLLSITRDAPKSPKPDKAVGSEPAEPRSDCAPKRRSSWRNATSVSFDTAMARAKDRQSQNPVRRMQTYCIGDSYDVMDSPKFTIKAASSRTPRPLSSLSSAEAEFRGNNFLPEDRNALSIHGGQSQFQQEAYTKELPQRNRLSMPRIGQQSTDEVHIPTACHQRRSLL